MQKETYGKFINQIHNSIEKNVNNQLREKGLTFSQMNVLITLVSVTEKRLSFKELEKRLTKSQESKDRIERNLSKKTKKYDELSAIERKEFIDENIKSIVLCANKNVRVNYVA